MAFGLKLPQGDKTAKVNSTKGPMLGTATAPLKAQKDGPAKDSVPGKIAGKPPTSAKAAPAKKGPLGNKQLKAMKASLGSVGRF